MSHKLYIKNMVCNRCILVVRQELEKLDMHPVQVSLGEVELQTAPDPGHLRRLNDNLQQFDFQLLDNKRQRQIEKIKSLIIQKVQGGAIEEHFILSDFLGGALHRDYSAVSRLFSEVEGITIEQFFILQKVEKIKEWMVYDEWTLSEIAWKLGYSSISHLSAQFKKVTGLAPSHFRRSGTASRKSLDDIA